MVPKLKIRRGDKVVVLQGKDRRRQGVVKRVFPKKRLVLVEGVNLVKKHIKAQGKQPGGILEIEKPLPVSKVMVVCPHCQKPTRVKYQIKAGKKLRVCRHCGGLLGGNKDAR